jgi:hypothetical protein
VNDDIPAEDMTLYHGASWMDLQGRIHIVKGFHEEWLHEHPELSGGNRTVADLILDKRWISVVLFSKGYLEICINDRKDCQVVERLHAFLERNKDKWENALIMPLAEEEGFIQLSKAQLGTRDDLLAHFAKTACSA